MASTQVVYPDADHAHAQELDQPLTVDGSAYTEPGILAYDTAAYQGGDGNADGLNPAVLTLPEVAGAGGGATGVIDLMHASHWTSGITAPNHYPPGSTIGFSVPATDRNGQPFTLRSTDVIEVEVFTQTAVSGAPTKPTIAGLSATWNERFHEVSTSDYRPQPTKWWTTGVTGAAGSAITVTWLTASLRRDGQIRIWRGVDTSSPYDAAWSSARVVRAQSFPNAAAVTVTTQGATVYMTAGGDVVTTPYTTPVVPTLNGTLMTEIVNSAKSAVFRYPVVAAMRQSLSPGSYNPAAMTGLDYSNEYASTDVLKPAATVEVPVLVIVAVTDETATAELVDGDVALTAANEVQRLTSFLVGSGTRTLTFSGQTTAAVNYDDDASDVQTKLLALSNLAPGDIDVSGGPLDVAPVLIEFSGGSYDQTDVPQITVSGSNTDPVNEVQSIQSTATGGTFLLDAGTVDTTALSFDATRAQVQAALEDLPEVGLNNVEVTGGPLPGTPIVVEFVAALAGTNIATLGLTDSTTGGSVSVSPVTAGVAGAGMVVETLVVGSAGEDFELIDSFLVRAGAYEPEIHVFGHLLSDYTPGTTVDVRVADHDGLHSWAAILLIPDSNVDPDDPIGAVGSETGDTSGTTAVYGSVTPSVSGAKVLALLAKARVAGPYVGTPAGGTAPAGYTVLAEALADAMTLMITEGPPVGAAATQPGASAWSGSEAWATALLALKPLVGSSAGTSLYEVLDSEDTSDWIDIAPAAGSMFEVLEFDLGAVPADAVLTGASIEFAHASDVPSQLRVALVGIDSDGGVHLAAEQQVGYTPAVGGGVTTVATNYWTKLADGSLLNEYDRLGVALISSSRHPALSNHRVYWVRATVRYEEGGPVVANVVGPAADGDPITWEYSSAGGFPQTYYELVVIQGSAQDPDAATAPDNPLDPATGELVYQSGLIPGTLTRSVTLESDPLTSGVCTVAVRAWSSITSTLLVASEWVTADFNIPGTPTTTPDQSGTEPTYDPETGGVEVTVEAPADAARAWLVRSTDGGTVWELTEGSPFEVTPSTSNDLTDVYAPGAEVVSYGVAFDEGPMTESGTPEEVGTAGVDTTPTHWLMIVPDAPALTAPIEVAAVSEADPVISTVAQGPDGAVVAQSRPLGHQMNLTVRTRSKAARTNLLAVLTGGYTVRIVNILGESWLMRKPSDIELQLQRWKPDRTETTQLHDAFEVSFQLVEVAAP